MGDWFDEYLGYFGGEGSESVAADLVNTGTDINWEDIVSGYSDLYDTSGSDYGTSFDSPSFQSDSPSYNYTSAYNSGDPYNSDPTYNKNSNFALSNSANDKEASLFDQAAGFIGKNKKLTDMGIGLIGGMYNSSEKKKEDAKAYDRMLEKRAYDEKIQREKEERAAARGGGGGGSSAMEMLAAKDALDQAKNARFSSSITGLRKPDGLMNRGKKLTYVGGKPVYTDDGKLAA